MPLKTWVSATIAAIVTSAAFAAPATATPLADWIDFSYGSSGAALLPGEAQSIPVATMDTAGRALVASMATDGTVRLRRLTSDGDLDTSFAGGTVMLPAMPHAIHGDAAGTVTLAGVSSSGGVTVSRLTSAGEPDPSFGTGGSFTLDLGAPIDLIFGITQRPDQSLIVDALSQASFPVDTYLIGVTAAGSLDTTWAPNQPTPGVLPLPGLTIADLAAVDDGIAALTFGDNSPSSSLVRFTATGTIDTGFGDHGRLTFAEGFHARVLSVSPDAYLVGGSVPASQFEPGTHAAVVKVLAAGDIDTSFGQQGTATGSFHECGISADAVMTTDTHVYVTGTLDDCGASPIYVNRFTATGDTDLSYGHGGELVVDTVAGHDVLGGTAIGLQTDGKMLAVLEGDEPVAHIAAAGVIRLRPAASSLSCTATSVNLAGITVARANPADAPCLDDTAHAASVNLTVGTVKVAATMLTAYTDYTPSAGNRSGTATAHIATTRIVIGSPLPLVTIDIGTISSTASVHCIGDTPAFTGTSSIANLKINGIPVAVGNTPLAIPLIIGQLRLNSTTVTEHSLTQHALILDTPLTDVTLGQTKANIEGTACHT